MSDSQHPSRRRGLRGRVLAAVAVPVTGAGVTAGSLALGHDRLAVAFLAIVVLAAVPVVGFTVGELRLLGKMGDEPLEPDEVRALMKAYADAFAWFLGPTRDRTPAPRDDAEPLVGAAAGAEAAAALPEAPDAGPSNTGPYPAGSFLGELGAAQAAELCGLGRPCVFGTGDVLFRKGDHAAHVVVICTGWARVTVPGAAATIAERGSGDLVGERAASREPERSATVVAATDLHGMRIGAADFSAFLAGHPDAVDVLERQFFARMTEPAAWPALTGQVCAVFRTDIAGFSDDSRSGADRSVLVDACYAILRDAFTTACIDWHSCHVEDRGDGPLIIVPSSVPVQGVVDGLVDGVAAGLREHNTQVRARHRFALRIAVDVGPVAAHEYGVNSEAVISAARLIEAAELKDAVARPGVVLGFITSGWVYDTVIRHLPRPGTYRRVRVDVKTYHESAWMRMY